MLSKTELDDKIIELMYIYSGTLPEDIFQPLSDYLDNNDFKSFFDMPFSSWMINGILDFINKYPVKLQWDRDVEF